MNFKTFFSILLLTGSAVTAPAQSPPSANALKDAADTIFVPEGFVVIDEKVYYIRDGKAVPPDRATSIRAAKNGIKALDKLPVILGKKDMMTMEGKVIPLPSGVVFMRSNSPPPDVVDERAAERAITTQNTTGLAPRRSGPATSANGTVGNDNSAGGGAANTQISNQTTRPPTNGGNVNVAPGDNSTTDQTAYIIGRQSNGTNANGTNANGINANGTTANGTTANGTTANGTTANGTTANGTTANGAPNNTPTNRGQNSTQGAGAGSGKAGGGGTQGGGGTSGGGGGAKAR